jgi:hypothetical protein
LNDLALGALVVVFSIWALTLFNISPPRNWGRVFSTVYEERFGIISDVINPMMTRPLPMGSYLGSVAEFVQHAREGHAAFLLGNYRHTGWWYYFPVVATYKIPVGIGVVMMLALGSAVVSMAGLRSAAKLRWGETPLLVAGGMWTVAILMTNINIGFRHALPAYVFMLMLCGRCAAAGGWLKWGAWAGLLLAAVHVASWHPNYLSYINFPREKAHLAISDSNIDWGQALKQVATWLDENPQGGRNVYLGYFGDVRGHPVEYHLGDRVIELDPADDPPTEGVLILSPVWEVGLYSGPQWTKFQPYTPVAVIGGSMLVYDLDRIRD